MNPVINMEILDKQQLKDLINDDKNWQFVYINDDTCELHHPEGIEPGRIEELKILSDIFLTMESFIVFPPGTSFHTTSQSALKDPAGIKECVITLAVNISDTQDNMELYRYFRGFIKEHDVRYSSKFGTHPDWYKEYFSDEHSHGFDEDLAGVFETELPEEELDFYATHFDDTYDGQITVDFIVSHATINGFIDFLLDDSRLH
ncbi:MAG: hypothetical protein ACXAEU_18885 [Candidatus Hodarchaeales archaeon]|jgi:hypothetical protein